MTVRSRYKRDIKLSLLIYNGAQIDHEIYQDKDFLFKKVPGEKGLWTKRRDKEKKNFVGAANETG